VKRLFCKRRDCLGIRRYALKEETIKILTLLKSYFERKLNARQAKLLEVSLIISYLGYILIAIAPGKV
jgi:hypothetical protein